MPATLNMMVCVTNHRTCQRLIERGIQLKQEGTHMHVVHCVQTGHNFMGTPYEADAIEYLFTAAQLAGAELTLLREDSALDALVKYAHDNSIGLIVMGASPERDRGNGESISMRLQRMLPDVKFDIVM